MNILDAKLGGKIRAAVAVLSAVVVALTSPAVADMGWTWLAPVVAGVNAVLSVLTHLTPIGDAPA